MCETRKNGEQPSLTRPGLSLVAFDNYRAAKERRRKKQRTSTLSLTTVTHHTPRLALSHPHSLDPSPPSINLSTGHSQCEYKTGHSLSTTQLLQVKYHRIIHSRNPGGSP
ncbi:hypothetical protein I308_102161 [Cryptococcus tetragattii IND107]|uniref:Uncharacterized protein n=1 Tax=Cryptococcus tetragattii IND107 TaxID=1296105 RepID=A0ABR3BXC7_9TREE